MRRSQKIYLALTIVLAFILISVLTVMLFLGRYELIRSQRIDLSTGAKIAQPAETDAKSLSDAFLRYAYYEEHDDGSAVNYIIYPFDGKYCGCMKYSDPSGGMYISSVLLPEEAALRFERSYTAFTLASPGNSKRSAKLWFTGKSGESSYSVTPLDISGMGFSDPWSETKPSTVVGLADEVSAKYDMDAILSLANCHSDEEIAAYISCLDRAFRMDGGEVKRVSVTGKFDGGYQVVVEYTDGKSADYRVSAYGYAERM